MRMRTVFDWGFETRISKYARSNEANLIRYQLQNPKCGNNYSIRYGYVGGYFVCKLDSPLIINLIYLIGFINFHIDLS